MLRFVAFAFLMFLASGSSVDYVGELMANIVELDGSRAPSTSSYVLLVGSTAYQLDLTPLGSSAPPLSSGRSTCTTALSMMHPLHEPGLF